MVRVQTGKWNARLEERSLHNVCLMLTICVVLLSALPAPLLHGVQDRARLAGLTGCLVEACVVASQVPGEKEGVKLGAHTALQLARQGGGWRQ